MEMAHLYRHVGKYFSHAFPAIQDDSLEDEPPLLDSLPWILSRNEIPEDIFFEFRRSEHEYPVAVREKRDVSDENERLRRYLVLFENYRVEPSLDVRDSASVRFGKLFERLLSPDVFSPEIQMSALRSPFPLELESAMHTFVPLDFSSFPILLY